MSQVEGILRYAREGAGLFHAPDGTAYAAVEVDGHLETHAIRRVRFRDWILIRFLHENGTAPNSQILNDALNTIRAVAVYHGPEMPVFVRIAEHEGVFYIDLGNENWDAVRVTPEGYEVVARPPVGFAGTYVFVPRGTVRAYKAIGTERGRLLMAFVPGGPERLAEEFVKLSTEGEGVNRSTAQQNKMFAELNEKYDTEFVGPPL